ncbi:MAG: NAD(P)H-hydrate epimerase [Henriciella sp.]|uniref:NAD(P)H-hydrate epimerase n=1 Tax=Henriciella sp. TaxID=1968823 RepID=UPI0032EB701C
MSQAIITPDQMYAAEKYVFEAGTDSFEVMKRAGTGVGEHLEATFPKGSIRVLCGPGGNGGDGFIAAAHLRNAGRKVRVYLLGATDSLKGDSARAAALWDGPVGALEDALEDKAEITLDALFGGGLSRPLDGVPAKLAGQEGPVVSVDVPSGLDGLSAKPLGPCFTAALTVTFAALRPAHVLMPGRQLCGKVEVQEIGVPVPDTVQLATRGMSSQQEATAIFGEEVRLFEAKEFDTSFPDIAGQASNRIAAVQQAAARENHVIALLGEEAIIAHPDGRCVVNFQAGV